MNSFLEKLNSWTKTLVSKLPSAMSGTAPKIVIMGTAIMFAVLVILFITGYLFNWYVEGKADLRVLISFIAAITAPSVIMFITFIGKGFVDCDNDNIPDVFEDKEKK